MYFQDRPAPPGSKAAGSPPLQARSGNLGGTGHGFGIFAKNLNNRGQVAGFSDLPEDETFHAFIWSKATGIKDLGTLPGDVASGGWPSTMWGW
jgi:probable HAF family extracellular repeat protein